jgi:sugar phosphate isomerase/epimerase
MAQLREREIGVMFWAGRDDVTRLKSYGIRCGQLGMPWNAALDDASADEWRALLDREDFPIVTVVADFEGENYADIPTVERTVGFIPEATREARATRFLAISDFAAQLGVNSIACHIGFVPHNKATAAYQQVRDLVRRICDHAGAHGQTLALETGQEPADVLLEFLHDVERPNLKVNFDPANMILYGTGDPVEALGVLAPHVISVHCKDGDWPPKDKPGSLGTERPLGEGSVGIPRFIAKLKEIGYRGPLNIEREGSDPERRQRDIAAAVPLLESLRA